MPKKIKVGFLSNNSGVHVRAYLNALRDTEACSEDSITRRGTDRRSGVYVGKSNSFARQTITMGSRCLSSRMRKITVAKVISENVNYIRGILRCLKAPHRNT